MENLTVEVVIQKTKSEQNLTFFSDKVKKFFYSEWSIFIMIIFLTLITVIQISFDWATGNLVGNSQLKVDLIIWVASIFSISASIYSARLNRKFFAFATLGLLLWIWRSLLVGLMLNMIKIVILFIPSIIRFARWENEKSSGKEIKVKRMNTMSIIAFIFIFIGLIILTAFLLKLFSVNVDSAPIPDTINLVVGVGASLIIAFGYLEGWFFLLIAGIAMLTSYIIIALNGITTFSISGSATVIIFLLLNLGSGLTWLSIYHTRNKTFKYIKSPKDKKPKNEILVN